MQISNNDNLNLDFIRARMNNLRNPMNLLPLSGPGGISNDVHHIGGLGNKCPEQRNEIASDETEYLLTVRGPNRFLIGTRYSM